MMLKKATIWC